MVHHSCHFGFVAGIDDGGDHGLVGNAFGYIDHGVVVIEAHADVAHALDALEGLGHVVDAMLAKGLNAHLTPSFDDTEAYLRGHWQPGDSVVTLGCGDIYLLFAVAFSGDSNEILNKASASSFDELAAELRYAHAACAIHFGKQTDIWLSAYRMMEDFGDYTVCHDGEGWWYPYDLCRHISNWHGIMTHGKNVAKDVWPRANPVVVRYLRSSFLPLEQQEREEVSSSPMSLISKIARTNVGQKLFKSIWDYTEGRFKTTVKVGQNGENLYQIIFKGKISLFRLISDQYRENVKDDSYIVIGNDRKKFNVWLKEGNSSEAPVIAFIETDNKNFECELSKLDEVVTCFVQNGGLLEEVGEEKEHDEIC